MQPNQEDLALICPALAAEHRNGPAARVHADAAFGPAGAVQQAQHQLPGPDAPWQLANQAAQGCNHSRERFVEFAQAFKGRHQLQFSRSLKAYLAELEEAVIVDDSEEGDQVLASALDDDSVLLLELSDQQFDKVVRNRVQRALLVIARNQRAVAVLEFIGQLPDNPPDDFSG